MRDFSPQPSPPFRHALTHYDRVHFVHRHAHEWLRAPGGARRSSALTFRCRSRSTFARPCPLSAHVGCSALSLCLSCVWAAAPLSSWRGRAHPVGSSCSRVDRVSASWVCGSAQLLRSCRVVRRRCLTSCLPTRLVLSSVCWSLRSLWERNFCSLGETPTRSSFTSRFAPGETPTGPGKPPREARWKRVGAISFFSQCKLLHESSFFCGRPFLVCG